MDPPLLLPMMTGINCRPFFRNSWKKTKIPLHFPRLKSISKLLLIIINRKRQNSKNLGIFFTVTIWPAIIVRSKVLYTLHETISSSYISTRIHSILAQLVQTTIRATAQSLISNEKSILGIAERDYRVRCVIDIN